ncbi:MAG: hypothetical protein ABJL63_11730 [Rhizobiaceae bacterium]
MSLALVNEQEAIRAGLVERVVSGDDLGPVLPRAMRVIANTTRQQRGVVIVTETTFRNLLRSLSKDLKSKLSVFVDEGMQPLQSVEFRPQNQGDFLQYFDQDDKGFISPKKGCEALIEDVAFRPKKLGERQLGHLKIEEFVEICSLVASGNYDVFLMRSDKAIMAVAILSPQQMFEFRSVTLMVAIFEQTLLPVFWQQRYGIDFEAFDIGVELYDTHLMKGPDISISYLLHDTDNASKHNLYSNYETGSPNERDWHKQVICLAARAVANACENIAYCWAANNNFDDPEDILNVNRMPVRSAGMDVFKNFDTVVSLVCINPTPWVKTAIQQIFEVEDEKLYDLWRLSHTYQTIGRCSLRLRKSDRKIHLIVISRRCAEQLSNIFVGSVISGQLSPTPSLTKLRQQNRQGKRTYSGAENKAYSVYKKRAKAGGKLALDKERWYEEIRAINVANEG